MRDQPTNVSNIKNWLSPRGVIAGGRLALRLLAMVAFIVLSMLTLGLIAQVANGSLLVVVESIAAIFLIVGLPLAFWIILATLTKHYRAKGVWAPFLFALITPFMPFMFFVTWIFSSKERAKRNIQMANESARVTKSGEEGIETATGQHMQEQAHQRRPIQGDAKSRNEDAETVVRRLR